RALLALVVAFVALAVLQSAAIAKPRPRTAGCTTRILVLSAMPVEIQPLLEAASLDLAHSVVIHDRKFWTGKLAGNDVVLAMTGIGPANAQEATQDAFDHFRCGKRSGFSAAVFSGVAGTHWIGDVAVPARWTEDKGK